MTMSQFAGLRFVVIMIAVYLACEWGYKQIPDAVLRDTVYFHAFVRPGAALLNLVAPGEQVLADGNFLRSPRAVLEIVRGCDGSGTLFLVTGAVLAFPARWSARVIGALGGAAVVYGLNTVRLVGLYFVQAYRADWFQPLHTYFVPSLLVLTLCVCFMHWAAWASPPRDAAY